MDSHIDEKEQFQTPCIMVTPSSPVHEHDYQVHYFEPERLQPGMLYSMRRALQWQNGIALPADQYAYGPDASDNWSASKRFRVIIMLIAALFFALHVFVLPTEYHHHHYHGDAASGPDALATPHAGSQSLDDAIGSWAAWKQGAPAPQPVHTTTMTMDDVLASMAM